MNRQDCRPCDPLKSPLDGQQVSSIPMLDDRFTLTLILSHRGRGGKTVPSPLMGEGQDEGERPSHPTASYFVDNHERGTIQHRRHHIPSVPFSKGDFRGSYPYRMRVASSSLRIGLSPRLRDLQG